ncbi:type IV pilus twitching motility protein PilT [bacterium]|nr:type IV pilus twitching motility protein PilT [bacterium]MBU1637605.1 type IV pilus twitching motility protein PilT [bacterium]MBU1921128.1 type IV pilus twitching motility protein PilT [bacterium]
MSIDIRKLLEQLVNSRGSDLHLTVKSPPRIRIDQQLIPLDMPELTPDDCKTLAYSILTDKQQKRLEMDLEVDFAFGIEGVSRFRGNIFHQRGSLATVVRSIPFTVPTIEALKLPKICHAFPNKPKGLILVTGPTGSGKSTSLAAIIDRVNTERQVHIITIEDPVEYVHTHKRALVNQREVEADTRSFATALKYVLRQDPDVILVGEMRDLETIQAALTAAETGHLVLATLHTNSATESVNRIIDVFPPHQQGQVRAQLSMSLEAVMTQKLIPRKSGTGVIMAAEVMICTPAIRALIRENKVHEMYGILQVSQKYGMQTLNQSLYDLVISKVISPERALYVSNVPEELQRMLGKSPATSAEGARGLASRTRTI